VTQPVLQTQLPRLLYSFTPVVPAVVAQVFEQVVSPAAQLPRHVIKFVQAASFEQAVACVEQTPPVPKAVFWQSSQVCAVPVVLFVEPVVLFVEPVVLFVEPVVLFVEPVVLFVEPVVEPVLDVTEPLHQLVIDVAALLQLLQLEQANTCPSLVV
jgi:hypothetical protein